MADRLATRYTFDKAAGCRIDRATGTSMCVHPFRVGLAPGLYASASQLRDGSAPPPHEPTAEQLVLLEAVADLEGWIVAMLRSVPHHEMAFALERAEAIAAERFTGEQIVARCAASCRSSSPRER